MDRHIARMLKLGISPNMLIDALTRSWRELEREWRGDEEFLAPVRECIYQPRIDALMEIHNEETT